MERVKEMLLELRDKKIQKEKLEAELKELNKQIGKLENELYDMLEELDLDNITIDGTTFYTSEKVYVSCKKAYVPLFKEWASENAPELLDYFREQINTQSLSKWYRERLEAGEEITLPEYIQPSPKRMVNVRGKYNGKEEKNNG